MDINHLLKWDDPQSYVVTSLVRFCSKNCDPMNYRKKSKGSGVLKKNKRRGRSASQCKVSTSGWRRKWRAGISGGETTTS